MSNYSDEELISRVAKGDEDAFATLSKRYSKSLYGLVYRMFYSFNQAEDITQEVMIKIWRKANMWEKSKGKVFSWMYRIAVNHCLDEKRKNKAKIVYNFSDEQFVSKDKSADNEIQDKQEADSVKKEILTLPERQRMALNLFFYDGLKVKEVAEAMECTEKAVENLLLRGKRALQERLT